MCGMIFLVSCDRKPLKSAPGMAMTRAPRPASHHKSPQCNICSFNQPRPEIPKQVIHRHFSSRQVRVTMGVEHHSTNPFYLCPTCQAPHLAYQNNVGLNVCVSTSQLHTFHQPREPGIVCPPDSLHVDWLTIPGANIDELGYAWRLDYHREPRPMRILLVAGLNDLLQGSSVEKIKESIESFHADVSGQDRYHMRRNEFSVAPLLNPPKLAWFPDNGTPPPQHKNQLVDLFNLNEWIKSFNMKNGIVGVPNFSTWATRKTTKVLADGSRWEFKTHRWNEWRQSEARHDMLHLNDAHRIKMAKFVMNFFQGELERKGLLL